MRESAYLQFALAGALASILVVLPSVRASAQQPSIDRIALGPLEITLGDDEHRTLEKLRSRYTVTQEKHDANATAFNDSWDFHDADESGSVDFVHGKAVLVIRRWAPKSPAASSFARELMDILDGLSSNGVKACQLEPQWAPAATGARSYGVVFVCGSHHVTFYANQSEVSIVETLAR